MAIDHNLYDILNVSSTSSTDEIRRQYRILARQLHPDRASQSDMAKVTMAEVNYAWSVLSDPVRRREYDRQFGIQRVSSAAPRGGNGVPYETEARPMQGALLPQMRFPWRPMLVVALLGAIVVFILHSFSEPAVPGVPDQLLESGSCVVINEQNLAVEVSCMGPHEYVVSQLVAFDRTCPTGMEAFKDRQGMGIACVEPTATTP